MTKKKQPHTRASFEQGKLNKDTPSMAQLIGASITASSRSTYTAALNTLARFLQATRALQKIPNPITCKEQEFEAFLGEIAKQGLSTGDTFRCALLHEQRRMGVPCFAGQKCFVLACKGIKRQHQPAVKGIITIQQLSDLIARIETQNESTRNMTVKTFVPQCKTCTAVGNTKRAVAAFNTQLARAIELQFFAQLRPGELEKLKARDLILTTEGTGKERQEVFFLYFASRKNAQDPGKLVIPNPGVQVFKRLAQSKAPDDFILPRCIDRHIGEAMRQGQADLGWHPDMVWVAHCLRHSVFSTLATTVQAAVDSFVAGVSADTFRGTYTIPMHTRVDKCCNVVKAKPNANVKFPKK